jgi:hypothetical protein
VVLALCEVDERAGALDSRAAHRLSGGRGRGDEEEAHQHWRQQSNGTCHEPQYCSGTLNRDGLAVPALSRPRPQPVGVSAMTGMTRLVLRS